MARKFTTGRQNDLALNKELYQLLMALRYFNNGAIQPTQDKQAPIPLGAIWNDIGRGQNILKINKSDGQWVPAFEGFYHPANLLMTPTNPTGGQIRINAEKDNLLEFYDENTDAWIAVKAVQTNSANVLVDMHNNFMHMTLMQDMDTQDDQKTFLVPYENVGKLFDDGVYIHPSDEKYEVGSEVSVVYKTTSDNQKESWVHINPNKIFKMEKKIAKIDKTTYKIYGAFDNNTEFYILDEKGTGTLLQPYKNNIEKADYRSFGEGIELLSQKAKDAEYIYMISSVFYDTARPGKLVKKEFTVGSTAEIHVGKLTKRPMIFLDGLYLEQSKYDYDSDTGNIEIDDTIINPMDMMAIVFQDLETEEKEINNITDSNGNDTIVGTFNKANTFAKPLAFVSGVMGTNIFSPEEIEFNGSSLTIKNFGPGVVNPPVKVMVVEADNMYLTHGSIDSTKTIKHEDISNNPNDEYILFVDGVLVSSRDLIVAEGEIILANAVEGQQYVLLKIQDDETTALSFDSKVMNFTVSIKNPDGTLYNECDNALIYADGKMIATEDALLKPSLPVKGITGQIVKVKSNDSDSVYKYYTWNTDKAAWDIVTDNSTIQKYESMIKATYSAGSIMLNSTGLEGKKGTYYAYTYANGIEEPLLKGQRTIRKDVTEYAVNVEHSFNTGQGAFSAYLDGILCPHIEENDNTGKFTVPPLIADGDINPYDATLTYYIERPERTELVSCYREVLTAANRTTEYDNGYKTTISLIPGVVAMYVNGVRLEKSDYSIISPNEFVLHRNIVGSQKNYNPDDKTTWNKYWLYNKDNQYEIVCHRNDEIVVEVRQDYSLKTQTIPVRYSGQRAFYMEDDGIPKSLILTQDLIKIYIDGVLYDGEYIINRDSGAIILLDPNLEHIMNVDPIAKHFDMYPEEHDEYIKEHSSAYIAKPRINRITFEWR